MNKFYWDKKLTDFGEECPPELDETVKKYLIQTYDELVKQALNIKEKIAPANLEASILQLFKLEAQFSELIFYYTHDDNFSIEEIKRALNNDYSLADYLTLFDSNYYSYLSYSMLPVNPKKKESIPSSFF